MYEAPGSIPGISRWQQLIFLFLMINLQTDRAAAETPDGGCTAQKRPLAVTCFTTFTTSPSLELLPMKFDNKYAPAPISDFGRETLSRKWKKIGKMVRHQQLNLKCPRFCSHVKFSFNPELLTFPQTQLRRNKGPVTRVSGLLSQQGMRLLISRSWVRAPRWACSNTFRPQSYLASDTQGKTIIFWKLRIEINLVLSQCQNMHRTVYQTPVCKDHEPCASVLLWQNM